MSRQKKIAMVSAAVAATALVGGLTPTAFAGTGGSTNAGVVYGQDAAYCDSNGATLSKTDTTGNPLGGAVFTITNSSSPANELGVKVSATEPTATTIAADRVKWQEAFDAEIDKAFSATDYGKAWLAASVKTADATAPGAGSDTDPTKYGTTDTITFPADIRAVTDPSAQSAAMQSWVSMPAAAATTSTVSDFAARVNKALFNVGSVLYSDYNATTGTGTTINPALAGTDAEAAVKAEYDKAFAEYQNLAKALTAAGYPAATFLGNPATATFNAGDFDKASQNWTNFVAAYAAMVKVDDPTTTNVNEGAFSFGIAAPTYDVIENVIKDAGVIAAEKVANAAVGATDLAPGANTTATSGADGKVYYTVFGRSITDVSAATPDTGSLDKTCGHLALSVAETTAPAGYMIDDPAAKTVTPANTEDTLAAALVWTDTLEATGVPDDKPVPPEFESGI